PPAGEPCHLETTAPAGRGQPPTVWRSPLMIHHPRVSRRAVLGASLALPAAATLAACRGETLSVPVDNTPTKITYLTNFGTFGRDAYAWLGQAAGHFADHGLEVDIQPGSGTQENVAELIAGNAHFAAVDL